MEIAKLRAARILWAQIMRRFRRKRSPLHDVAHTLPDFWRQLARTRPYNNIIRTTLEALSAILGGTQSLHTNSFDEAIALPSETPPESLAIPN